MTTTTSTIDHAVLVDAGWLAEHLSDPLLRVVEVDVSPTAYQDGHIDGAVLWNIYTDLKDPTTSWSTLRRWRRCWPARASRPTRRWCSTGTARRWGSGC